VLDPALVTDELVDVRYKIYRERLRVRRTTFVTLRQRDYCDAVVPVEAGLGDEDAGGHQKTTGWRSPLRASFRVCTI
jgi:hypothetical protein